MRFRLTIAYDGRPFRGWQSQPGGHTVQDHLQAALAAVAKRPLSCTGSGRTDAGVHALGQVAHFDAPPGSRMDAAAWRAALNSRLPAAIRVMECAPAPEDFHARFSATWKTYHYDVCQAPVLPPLRAGLVWHLPQALDPGKMAAALDLLRGRHDFEAFCAYRGNESAATDHRRHLGRAACLPLEDGWRLEFTADGFLYKMVRMMAGVVVRIGRGRMCPREVSLYLDQPPGLPRGKCTHCAPPHGLYLQQVGYPETRLCRE